MSAQGRAPLRVLLGCEWFVKYTAGLARGLADVGCDVTLLTRTHDLEFGRQPGAMRAFVQETLDGRAAHLALGGRVRELARVPEARRLRQDVRARRPQVVHLQDSIVHDLRLAYVAGARPKRYAVTVHDPTPHPGDPQVGRRIGTSRRALRRNAALVFAHSEVLAEELRASGAATGPVVVIPHGIGEVISAPLPATPSLLFFGRISHYKGLDTLLDALPLAWERVPELRLTIAGRGDLPAHPVLEDARVTVRQEHVPEEAVSGLFAAATCVVLPYRQASQSGVGSQARQHGRAVISTTVGGLPELVDAASGRLVAPEDPPALADAIVEVVGTPGLAERMGAAAAGWAADAGWTQVARVTLAAYERHLL